MELGYIDGHQGFMFTSLMTESQTSNTSAYNVAVVFNDPAFGPFGAPFAEYGAATSRQRYDCRPRRDAGRFQSVYVQNKSRVGGAEALYIYRASECPLGGDLEFTAGGRYLELKDQFWVDARGGNLTDSYWNTTSHNEIAGPEIGVRYYQPYGRFGISAEGRFTAGINAQSVDQDGILASGLVASQNVAPQPLLMGATGFNNSTHWVEFSPIIELRVEAHMQLTNIIAVKAGYTGIFINNVVRAADMVNYHGAQHGDHAGLARATCKRYTCRA